MLVHSRKINRKQFPSLTGVEVPVTPHKQKLMPLPDGVAGIRLTIRYMDAFASQYKMHPTIRGLALKLTRELDQKDFSGEVRALFSYVKNRVRYVHDINGVETLQSPVKTLEFGQGDCDDKSTLLASLLQSIGYQTRFHALGVNGGKLCHVIVEVKNPYNQNWVALDATENHPAGWKPANITVSEFSYGLGDLGFSFSSAFKSVTNAVKKVASAPKKIAQGTITATKKVGKITTDTAKKAATATVQSTKALSKGDIKGSVKAQYAGAKAVATGAFKAGMTTASQANETRKILRDASTPTDILKIENKAVDAAAKVLTSKQFQLLTTILSFIPITAPFAWAVMAAQYGSLIALAEQTRQQISAMTAAQKKAFTAALTPLTYVYDPALKAIRLKDNRKASDNNLPTYRYNANTDAMELVDAKGFGGVDPSSSATPAGTVYNSGGSGGGDSSGSNADDGSEQSTDTAVPEKKSVLPLLLTAGTILLSLS